MLAQGTTTAESQTGHGLSVDHELRLLGLNRRPAATNEVDLLSTLIAPRAFRFCWIVDYPMSALDEKTGRIEFSHNPFPMRHGGREALEGQGL